ncbi:peptidylprolyl isomerase [Balamuthia mandrillaris]
MGVLTVVFALIGFVALLMLARVWLRYQQQKLKYKHVPGVSQLLHFYSFGANLLPKSLFPYKYSFSTDNLEIFRKTGSPLISFVCSSNTELIVGDAELAKKVCVTHGNLFPKPTETYAVLRAYGENILTAPGGPEWKKHRALCSPAFSVANLRLVAETTNLCYKKLFETWDAAAQENAEGYLETEVNTLETQVKVALAIIAEAGFGVSGTLEQADTYDKTKHKLPFWEVMFNMTETLWLRLGMPWALKMIPFGMPLKARIAFEEFDNYVKEMITERKRLAEKDELNSLSSPRGRPDLLTLLLRAEDEESNVKLTDEEIQADIFMFLLAGHETTAHSVTFALGLIAAHQEVQQKMYEEIKELMASKEGDEELTYDDYKKLSYVACVFKETLRLFPPAVGMPKIAEEDIQLGDFFVPAKTLVTVSTWALHRNPKYWPEPDTFKPERFLKTLDESASGYNVYAYMPFSQGRRICLGMKFAETEAILALANIVYRYSVHIPPSVDRASMFDAHSIITLTPKHSMKLIYRKRR